ncbi:myocardin isoform X3 [Carettochelys insculpta]|uniref:myocardin isoform X3 n=1 Tax=Carettochelys insculpta TaxID=44489 RepID=UPI003EBE5716
MTLLGSEHSLLIRSKFRSVLQLRLQQRRTREQLADQGIMPPLKSPSAFHEQRETLERAKTEDYLKHKVRSRPEQSGLVNMHILQDSAAEGSIQATQMKLKRSRLADDLNEKIALRPGPLELVEKNIIPVDSVVKEAIKGAQESFSKSADAFSFEEDSSNDGLSPEQARREDLQGSTESPAGTKNSEAISSTTSGTTQDHSHSSENNMTDLPSVPNSQCESPRQMNGHQSPPLPVPAAVKTKSSSDSKNRHKKPKDTKPKVKKLKYHQYIPPDQKAEKSPPPMDSAYARLLQQQQLFLQLQILSQQQQQQQQHYSYPGIHQAHHKQPSEQLIKSSNSSSAPVTNVPLSPVKTTFSGQTCVPSIKPGPLPSNLDDLKVSELRQQLRIRGLPVSGTKTALMERLRPFQACGGSVGPNFNEITTVTFPVTPANTVSGYPSQPPPSMLSSSFYQFGSTSSTPPISPASSDLSVSGSLPDTFNDGPLTSPQFGLQPSPVQGSTDESLLGSQNGGNAPLELEGIDTEKDKMLVEKQKVINELTWKLQQEQRQVEELRLQLQKRKRSSSLEEEQPPPQHFFGVPIKQENPVSSCPFSAKQTALEAQANGVDKLSNCGTRVVSSHCRESAGQSTSTSSSFLSPQCSPQNSPLGAAKSPQHISLPPSPNSHYLLAVSPGSQGEGRSISPQASNRLRPAPMATQAGQKFPIPSPSFCKSSPALSEGKQPPSYADAVKQQMTRSQQMDELLDVLIESGAQISLWPGFLLNSLSPAQAYTSPCFSLLATQKKDPSAGDTWCSTPVPELPTSAFPWSLQPLPLTKHRNYKVYYLQRNEMPAHAKEERSCLQKVPQITVSSGNSGTSLPKASTPLDHVSSTQLSFDHCTGGSETHLEVLINSQSPLGRVSEISLLKLGGEEPHFDGLMDGFSSKVADELLTSQEIPLSPMETQLSPSPAGSALQMSFTESPWETMEWLDLTPPSSATCFGSLTTTGPSLFNIDFLDVSDLSLNTTMDLHLQQW